MKLLRRLLQLPIRAYRRYISPYTPATCRYHPTCSAYALEALERFGVLRGSWLSLRRVLRCHPFAGYGEDPVPRAGPCPQGKPAPQRESGLR